MVAPLMRILPAFLPDNAHAGQRLFCRTLPEQATRAIQSTAFFVARPKYVLTADEYERSGNSARQRERRCTMKLLLWLLKETSDKGADLLAGISISGEAQAGDAE
jgi:hypothetical protein